MKKKYSIMCLCHFGVMKHYLAIDFKVTQ